MQPNNNTSADKETALVAICLGGVARLLYVFTQTPSPHRKSNILQAAGDLLDRTVPYPEVREKLKDASDQLSVLVANRNRIGAVPPKLWRPDKARLSDLANEDYQGIRAVHELLRNPPAAKNELTWSRAQSWLAKGFELYPELKEEAEALIKTV